MKIRLSLLALFIVFTGKLFAQIPSTCFEITSILVDACGSPEANNEMLFFRVGPNPLNVGTLTVTWSSNSFLFICQNATSASKVATINSTITSCGLVVEPVGGVLPAGAKVVLVTSTDMDPMAHSFANLSDTLIMIFQCSGAGSGHFKNYSAGAGTRTTTLSFGAGCTDVATYDAGLLVNAAGNHAAANGAYALFSYPGNTVSYTNYGCQIPPSGLVFHASANQTSICLGNPINLSGTITSGTDLNQFWSGGHGSFTNPDSLSTTYTASSSFVGSEYLYLNMVNSCLDTLRDSVQITVGAPPNVSIALSGPSTFCIGGSVTLNASGATNYTWSNGIGFASVNANTSGVYTVVGTNTCGSDSDSVAVTVNASTPVSMTASGPTTFCVGDSITLTAANSGSYVWSTGATTSSIVVDSAGTYSVQGTDACGTSSESLVISTLTVPVVTITPASSTTFCFGSFVNLAASGADTYAWSNGQNVPTLLVTDSGTYTVTGMNVCGTDTASEHITVNFLNPVAIAASGPLSFCQGDSVTLTASGDGPYTWSTGSVATSIVAYTAGTYTLSGNAACGTSGTSVDVTVNQVPVVSIAASGTTTFCSGGSVGLTASGASSYTWSTGSSNSSITASSSGTYLVTGTTVCGSDTESVSVDVITQTPVSIALSGSNTICAGSSSTLTASGSGSYLWSTGETTASIVVSSANAYSVTATAFCGSTLASEVISILAPPVVSIAASGSTTICPGSSVTLSASGASSYSWSSGSVTASEVASASAAYTVTGTNTCGSDVATMNVTVISETPVSISPGGTATVCAGSDLTLTASGSGSYLWSTGEVTTSIVVNSANTYSVVATATCGTTNASTTVNLVPVIPVTISTGGSTTFCQGATLTLTASGGSPYLWSTGATDSIITVNSSGTYTVIGNSMCSSDTAHENVIMIPLPVVSIFPSSGVLCPGQSMLLTASGGGAYTWSTGSNATSIEVSQAGQYSVSISNSCGISKDTTHVLMSTIDASFNDNSNLGFAPLDVLFANTSSGATNYNWSFGDGSVSSAENPAYTFDRPGDFMVTLITSDANGCIDSTMHVIHVEGQTSVFMPNVFSPNGDGENDDFRVYATGAKTFQGFIYNRWGNLVFAWEDVVGGWDGRLKNGLQCPDGVYVYEVNIGMWDGSTKSLHGTISLVR